MSAAATAMFDTASQLATQWAIENLLARYVHALDDDRLEEWPAFFTEQGRYRITTLENHRANLPLCIVQADSRAMMRDRIAALRNANIYEAQSYRHTVSSTLVKPLGDKALGASTTYEAISNFTVTRIMHDGAMMLFATGRYVDRIICTAAGAGTDEAAWLFEDRLVILDSRRVDTLLAIPL
jgi:anthranilate 1,2-dioxygenase small subunit